MAQIQLTVQQTQFQFNTTGDSRRWVRRTVRRDAEGFYIIYRGSKYRVQKTGRTWEAV